MSVNENEVLVKISTTGTISIPKQFRKYLDLQKGEYVKLVLEKEQIFIRRVVIT